MKEEIKSVKDKDFYIELVNVASQVNNIRKFPNNKLVNNYNRCKVSLVINIIVLIIIEVAFFVSDTYLAGIFSFIEIFVFLVILNSYKNYNKLIKNYLEDNSDSIFIIDEDGIELSKEKNYKLRIEWDSLELIKACEKGIIFLSNDKSNFIIDIPVEYLNKVKDALKKYNIEKIYY